MTEMFRAAQVAPTEVVSSERTTDGSPLPRRGLRLSWQLPVLIVTWLSLLQWPVPPTGALDPSWCLVLSDAWQHGRQFGTEIIFTWGPWGFLFQPYVVPGTVSFKLAFDLAAKLLLAVGVVGFATRLGPLWRALFIIVVWWLGAVLWDPLLTFIIAAILTTWLLAPEARNWEVAAGVLVLGFLSLVKLTNLLLAASGIALTVVVCAATGRWRRAAGTVVGYTGALGAFWILAGQSPGNLVTFVARALDMSGGYAQAMVFDEPWDTFAIGATLVLLLTGWLVGWTWSRRQSLESLATAAVLFAALFVSWKHGFTRADNHVLSLFAFALYMAFALARLTTGIGARSVLVLVLIVGVTGFWRVMPEFVTVGAVWVQQRVVDSFRRVSGTPWRPALAADSVRLAKSWQLPAVRAAVGEATIDLVDFEQGLILLNDLTYQPRPVPQSYAAYTPELLRANLAFIESERAPEYLLVGAVAVDGRPLAQTDALLLAELPRRYEPLLEERGYTLLKRRSVQPPPRSQVLTPLIDVVAGAGQTIELPDETSHALWLQVQIHRSLLGHLRSLFYKPAMLALIAENESAHGRFLLVPGIAEAGFVLQPFLSDQSDLGPFLRGEGVRRARRIRIEATEGQERYWNALDVRVSRMESMPVRFLPGP